MSDISKLDLASFVGKNVRQIAGSLDSNYACICHLWPNPRGWPRTLWKRNGKGRVTYCIITSKRKYDFISDPMNLSGGRFVALIYRRTETKKRQRFIPIANLNVTRDQVIRYASLIEKHSVDHIVALKERTAAVSEKSQALVTALKEYIYAEARYQRLDIQPNAAQRIRIISDVFMRIDKELGDLK